ncbi:MAG: ABC transporter substrate-binding protein [Chloroflexi bacterium]|nr:ABC transporter substrate-binding protein [Chloroflexota bacterium]
MKKRIVWLVVSGLMVLSLALASCAPKVAEEQKAVTEKKEAVTEKKEAVAEKKEAVAEKKEVTVKEGEVAKEGEARYGGWLYTAITADPSRGFSRDGNFARSALSYSLVANESLLYHNELKGPRGTNEWSMNFEIPAPPNILTGLLAESFEVIQPDTMLFHIRKGVRWQDKPPANGMEFTAEDVVYSIVLQWGMPRSVQRTSKPFLSDLQNPANSVYVDPNDPWTVVTKTKPGELSSWYETIYGAAYIVPKAWGDPKGTGPDTWTWKTVVGTGPFLLTDYVTGSSLTWTRNPNYWRKDPFRPQNQLPYVDGIKAFIIPDVSTRQAALRTGKIDILENLQTEHWDSLKRSNPDLKYAGSLSQDYWGMHMRNDRKPFDDVRVRRAMTMAINYDEIVNDYYGGKAVKFYWPAWPIPEHKLMFTPLEQMPKEVQELFTYNPDKAKQLLADAGYPKGFNTSIIISSAQEEDVDLLSVIKSYWAKVGVNLEIQVKDPAVYTSMNQNFSYDQGTFANIWSSGATKFNNERVGSDKNHALVNSELMEKTFQAVAAVYFDWAKVSSVIKERAPEMIMYAPHIRMPIIYTYTMWQPWVKDFDGSFVYGYKERDTFAAGKWVWIDQDLKQKMTGRR